MAIRIQLASNFQVIELTYNSWNEVTDEDLEKATNMVNNFGQIVKNDIKTKDNKKEETKEKPASEKQLQYIKMLGGNPKFVKTYTDANKMIRELKEAQKYTEEDF